MLCPICSSVKSEVIFEAPSSITTDRQFLRLPIESRLCIVCGATYDAKGARTNAQQFYAESYDLHSESALSEFQVHMTSNSKGESDSILEFISNNIPLKNSGSMLEVGCGKGVLLGKFMKSYPNWNVSAIEPSSNAAEYFRKALPSVNFFEGVLGDSPFANKEYDFVATSGVLEHVPDPLEFLREIRNCMKPGGFAYIGVPNFKVKPDDLLVFDHLTQFTCESLNFIYQRVGLKLHSRDARDDRVWLWDAVTKCPPNEILLTPVEVNQNLQISRGNAQELARQQAEFDSMISSLDPEENVAIYGIGVGGLYLYSNSDVKQQIKYILDDNPHSWGSKKLDLEICGSKDIPRLKITTVFLGANPCYHERMIAKLIDLGVQRNKIFG